MSIYLVDCYITPCPYVSTDILYSITKQEGNLSGTHGFISVVIVSYCCPHNFD